MVWCYFHIFCYSAKIKQTLALTLSERQLSLPHRGGSEARRHVDLSLITFFHSSEKNINVLDLYTGAVRNQFSDMKTPGSSRMCGFISDCAPDLGIRTQRERAGEAIERPSLEAQSPEQKADCAETWKAATLRCGQHKLKMLCCLKELNGECLLPYKK